MNRIGNCSVSLNKIGFEPCGARSGERRVRWALEATQEGGGNCSLGNVCATGERSIRAHHHPRVEAERSGRLSPVPRTGSASGVWKDWEGMGTQVIKKDEGRGGLLAAFKTGRCWPRRHPGAAGEEGRDPTGSAQVTCVSRLPARLHFRRLGVTTGYPGTRRVTSSSRARAAVRLAPPLECRGWGSGGLRRRGAAWGLGRSEKGLFWIL